MVDARVSPSDDQVATQKILALTIGQRLQDSTNEVDALEHDDGYVRHGSLKFKLPRLR